MARKTAPPELNPPSVSLLDGLRRLQRAAVSGEKLLNSRPIDETDYEAWYASAIAWLHQTFGITGPYSLDWEPTPAGAPPVQEEDIRFRNLTKQVRYLKNVLASYSHELEAPPAVPPTLPESEPDLLDVFISHSSADEQLAEALVRLLRNAFAIAQPRIRCTSVNGYKLEAGVEFEEQLKVEVLRSKVFIALITPASLASKFTLFELGARWGSRRRLVPIRACGADHVAIGRPLTSLHLLNGTDRGEMLHAMETISSLLQLASCNAAAWDSDLHNFVTLASASLSPLLVVAKASGKS